GPIPSQRARRACGSSRSVARRDRKPANRLPVPSRLRILSIGCSTGQEAYSLAMTARENLGGDAHRQVEILGVDVGRAALAAARRGVYGPLSVASVPPLYLERYFEPEGPAFTVRPELRAMVRFLRHDIRREPYLG